MKRRNNTASTRSFAAAAGAVWADMHNASRRLVERQMGPQRPRNS